MNPNELEALKHLFPRFNVPNYDYCKGYLDAFMRPHNQIYRGEAFLLQVANQFPWAFKLLADNEEYDIPAYIYIEAGIQAGGDLLKFFISFVPNVKDQVNIEVIFPEMMEKHWNIMSSWPEYASRTDWIETLALRWPTSFQFATPALQDDAAFVTQLILKQPTCFRYASLTLRNNPSFALLAVNLNESNFTHVGPEASLNYDLCHLVISKNPKRIQQIPLKHQQYAHLLAYALEKDSSIIHLVKKHLFDPKKILDKFKLHAFLYLSYGATPPRLKIKKTKSLNIKDQGRIKITLINKKKIQIFTLHYKKILISTPTYWLLNIDLRQQSFDQDLFLSWQKELTEEGAMQVQIQNVGVDLIT